MKPLAIVGILLVVIGVIGLAYGGISYTKEKTVVDIGPIKATADTRERFQCLRCSAASPSLAASSCSLRAGKR
jgi:hypothetical protein